MFTNQHVSRIVHETMSHVNLWTMFTNTLSHEKVTKIKVVDSEEFNNFFVHDFYCWNHLRFQNLVWSCHLVKFKISTVQIWSNENMIKIKVVHIDEFYNFGIHEFFIWNHLLFPKYCFKLKLFEFQILNRSNKVTWHDDQNKRCTCWWVIQLLCLQHFHFISFNVIKL